MCFPFWKTPQVFFSTPKIHPPIRSRSDPPILALKKKTRSSFASGNFPSLNFPGPDHLSLHGRAKESPWEINIFGEDFLKALLAKNLSICMCSTQKFTHFKKKNTEKFRTPLWTFVLRSKFRNVFVQNAYKWMKTSTRRNTNRNWVFPIQLFEFHCIISRGFVLSFHPSSHAQTAFGSSSRRKPTKIEKREALHESNETVNEHPKMVAWKTFNNPFPRK